MYRPNRFHLPLSDVRNRHVSCHFSDDAQRASIDLHLPSPSSLTAALSSPTGASARHLELFRFLELDCAPARAAPRIRCPLSWAAPLVSGLDQLGRFSHGCASEIRGKANNRHLNLGLSEATRPTRRAIPVRTS